MNFNAKKIFQYAIWLSVTAVFGCAAAYSFIYIYNTSVYNTAELIESARVAKRAAAVGYNNYARIADNASMVPSTTLEDTSTEQEMAVVKLIFVGDIMLDRGVSGSIERHGKGDFDFIFRYATATREADLTFGNLEGPISEGGRSMGSMYSFRMKPDAAAALRRAGFDVLSVANNHAGDWGPTALADTMTLLEQQGISAVGAGDSGAEADKATVVEVGGLGVAFMSFSDVGPNWLNASTTKPGIAIAQSAERVSEAVRRSASTTNADLLVVSFHFGEEYSPEPTVRQIELARAAITAGADIVVGHHPHVVQKMESYNGGVIVYSLGNFIFDQNFSKETMTGGALEVYIINGKIAWYKLREVQINSRFQAIIE